MDYVIPHPDNKGEGVIYYDQESVTIPENTVKWLLGPLQFTMDRIILNLLYLNDITFHIPPLSEPSVRYNLHLKKEYQDRIDEAWERLQTVHVHTEDEHINTIILKGKQLWI